MAIYKNTPPIVTNGLVALFDAENRVSYPGTGGTWNDIAGGRVATSPNPLPINKGFNLTYTGSYQTNTTSVNTSNAFTFPTPTNLGAGNFSLSVVFSINAFPPAESYILFGGNSAYWTNGFALSVENISSTYRFGYRELTARVSSRIVLTSDSQLQLDTIYMLTATRIQNANPGAFLYVNGVLLNQTNTFNTLTDNITPTTFGIGTDGVLPMFWPTRGNIYSTMAYNRTLSAAEVKQNYDALKLRYNI